VADGLDTVDEETELGVQICEISEDCGFYEQRQGESNPDGFPHHPLKVA